MHNLIRDYLADVNNKEVSTKTKFDLITYPNPVSSYLYILNSVDEKVTYEIYSQNGNLIRRFVSQIRGEQIIISTLNYLPGSYIIKAMSKDGESVSSSFIKT